MVISFAGIRKQPSIHQEESLLLQAFVGHLTVAISRIRQRTRLNELTDHVIISSRFIVAEELAGWAVHSLRRRLEDVLAELKVDINKKEIRENRFLLESVSRWKKMLVGGGEKGYQYGGGEGATCMVTQWTRTTLQ
jgi:hypothetical protein